MRNYTTQMDAARKGILTPEIKTVAQKEHMSTDEMMKLVAERQGCNLCQQKPHMSESGRRRQYASHEDQCKSRSLKRL